MSRNVFEGVSKVFPRGVAVVEALALQPQGFHVFDPAIGDKLLATAPAAA